jgi:tetratricopeptide (TPR) repeat protein
VKFLGRLLLFVALIVVLVVVVAYVFGQPEPRRRAQTAIRNKLGREPAGPLDDELAEMPEMPAAPESLAPESALPETALPMPEPEVKPDGPAAAAVEDGQLQDRTGDLPGGRPQPGAVDEPTRPETLDTAAEHVQSDDPLDSAFADVLEDVPRAPIHTTASRNAESYLDEGNVYFNVGQYALAIERYNQALDLDAGLVAAYYNRANALTRNGAYDQALADYDRALELSPADADAYNNRGMLHLYQGSYAQALKDFDAALAIDDSDTTVIVNRGLAQLHDNNPAAALRDFERAIGADPQDAAAHYGAGQASAALNERSAALRHLGDAMRIDPGYAREAAADPRLQSLQGDDAFIRLLRDQGARR